MLSNFVFKLCILVCLHSCVYYGLPIWVAWVAFLLCGSDCVDQNVFVNLCITFVSNLTVCVKIYIFIKCHINMGYLCQVLYGSWLCHSQKEKMHIDQILNSEFNTFTNDTNSTLIKCKGKWLIKKLSKIILIFVLLFRWYWFFHFPMHSLLYLLFDCGNSLWLFS